MFSFYSEAFIFQHLPVTVVVGVAVAIVVFMFVVATVVESEKTNV